MTHISGLVLAIEGLSKAGADDKTLSKPKNTLIHHLVNWIASLDFSLNSALYVTQFSEFQQSARCGNTTGAAASSVNLKLFIEIALY